MDRTNLWRRVLLFSAIGAWAFLLLALGSFHPTDWPSHEIYPYPPIQNLCGSAGAFVAYYTFLFIGQGVFPILFFAGICLTITLFRDGVSDLWLRVTGLALLTVAFATTIHHFHPGSQNGFPEGQGGIVGIGAASFLQSHFSTIGTRLILATIFLVGLLLAADDLVLRAPSLAGGVFNNVKERAPNIRWNFISFPKLPSLPRFVTKEAATSPAPSRFSTRKDDDDDEPLKLPVMLERNKSGHLSGDDIDLTYPNDEPAAAAHDSAFVGEDDPQPSAAATVPPATEQLVDAPPPELKKEIIVKLPNSVKPRQSSPPPPPPKELGEYHLPPWDCLADPEQGFAESQEKYVREKAAILEQALREFDIDAHVVEIDTGPVITMYELSLAPGIKVSQITALSNDIARALAAVSVRIVAPVPGKSTVGIEVPNAQKEKVRFKDLMQLAPEATRKMMIPLYLGKDASGEPLITDLAGMPHCLIAGTTGSGKSVCINTIIMSIMYTQRPDVVKLILVDPKVVEMAPFKDIPHLMCPVINDTGRATSVLEWACEKMDERYEFLAEAGVRNISGYNKLTREELIERFQPQSPEEEAKIPKQMPYIVIIIDELADLMMTSGKEVETFIVRLAQKARAVGIHLILATQRPQATVVTGLIKSNMPSKIAFRVASKMDSRIVLDQNGAELLLGQGDMLFLPPGASKPIRSQGTYIDDKEIRESVKLLRHNAEAQYEPELVQIKSHIGIDGEMEKDELFDDAVRIVLETKRGSVSLLQRRLTIGYSRASRLIEMMAATGIVGDYKGSQAREAMFTVEEWDAMKAARQADAESGMSV
ncbi:MAG: DNA translocase FtsK [Phycisphaerales bacterium]|jgi:S-DNA-T family DNA segregation ATPase FtsK/SpoIIIE|nr:DNA translocase FtsK [Phycisphaerales bacterium]